MDWLFLLITIFRPRATLGLVGAGSIGEVASTYVQKSDLSRSEKDSYPLVLIKLMTRYAEDLVWANKLTKAEAVFNFIITLTEGRSDATESRKGKCLKLTNNINYLTSQSCSHLNFW